MQRVVLLREEGRVGPRAPGERGLRREEEGVRPEPQVAGVELPEVHRTVHLDRPPVGVPVAGVDVDEAPRPACLQVPLVRHPRVTSVERQRQVLRVQ